MKKNIIIFALLVAFCGFLSETLVAQQQQQTKSRKRQVNKWINTADEAFKSGRYFKAFGYYDRAFQREAEGPVRMHLRERLGESQRRLNNPVESVIYFGRVWESGNRERSFLTSYADVLLRTANYEKAESLYQMLLRQDTASVFLQNRLKSAQLGLAHSDTLDVIFRDQIRPQHRIATPFSQYGMVIVDGKLVYSSTQRVRPALTDQRTGHGFSHLYQATLRPDSLLWENPVPLSFNIWGDLINDGVFTFDHVNRIGYFQRCNDGNCGIFTTTFENGVWTIPQKFEINGVGATNMVGHPAISPDGRRLIFATRAPEGEGGSDLWMTTRVERPQTPARRRAGATTSANPATSGRAATAATRQTERERAAPPPPTTARGRAAAPAAIINNPDWNVPVNLGKAINTAGDEVFPIWINNEAIAFSSNGHVGFGGLDIYVAIADSNGNFTEVHHLGAPINSSFDDYTLVISPNIDHIFFSSSRYVGFGHSDEIYSFPKTAAVLEFQFNVTDIETNMPLVYATIAVCEADGACQHLTTDSSGFARLVTQKTASVYDITFDKEDFYSEIRNVSVNDALNIIPLRDVRKMHVAMQRDTSLKIEFDPIPARWEFLAQNLEDDLIDVLAVVTLDTLAQLFGLNNSCVSSLEIILAPSANYTPVGEPRAMDNPLVRQIPTDTADVCDIFYHLNEAFFATTVVSHASGDFEISGVINYTIDRPDSTFVFTNVPFSLTARGREITEERPPLATQEATDDEQPAVTWFYSVNQVRGLNVAELVARAVIRPDAFMISDKQELTELLSPIVFNFTPDPERYELIGEPITNISPLILTPDSDPKLTGPISVFIDSVTFIQKVHLRSDTDFRITGDMDYTLGFERVIDAIADAAERNLPNEYVPFTGVPLSFPIFGMEAMHQPEIAQHQPETGTQRQPELDMDLSWAEGLQEIETPIFAHNRASLFDECDSINLMAECMRPGMTPQQIIECINRKRRDCEGIVDTRFVENYRERINDPNRRANMTTVPPGTPCIECSQEPQRHPADEPLFIEATDDKQTLRFTDNAGNITYFDLAPNTRYGIMVQNFVSDDIAALPNHISTSDIVRTVTTRDFVIFECIPKLSEIGDEVFVNNIYFDFDRSDIIRDGHRELDRMIIIAIKNPHMQFEIVSHADERGSAAYNLALTQRRLNSVLDYIRRKGMNEDRLITRAASNLEPLIRNAQTEAEHALNRRTTIRLFDPNAVNNLGREYQLHENSPFNKRGVWFRVQIAAFREAPEYPLYLFSDFMRAAPEAELTFYLDRDGLFKFTMGEFRDLNQARRLNQRILDANREAYVVAFVDGERVTIAEAQAVLRRLARN